MLSSKPLLVVSATLFFFQLHLCNLPVESLIVEEPCCQLIEHRVAGFGGEIPSDGITRPLKVPNSDGCDAAGAKGVYNDSFVLVERGNCTFAEKALIAQNAGASAIIVYNTPEGGDELIEMEEDDSSKRDKIMIPAVFIGNTGGKYLQMVNVVMEEETGMPAVIMIDKVDWWSSDILWFLCVAFTAVWSVVGICFVSAWCKKWWKGNERKRAVGRLKTRKYRPQESTDNLDGATEGDTKQADPKSEYDQSSCVICLCDFEENDVLYVLPCGHEYHKACIEPWLLTKSSLCPICKTSFLGDEKDGEQVIESDITTPLLDGSDSASYDASLSEEDVNNDDEAESEGDEIENEHEEESYMFSNSLCRCTQSSLLAFAGCCSAVVVLVGCILTLEKS